jgi:hypothetical protein
MNKEELQPVEVEWIDAQSSMDFYNINELKEVGEENLHVTKSCGYLIHKDKTKVVLAFMLFGDEGCKHHQIIPTGMIKRIIKLREVKNENKK